MRKVRLRKLLYLLKYPLRKFAYSCVLSHDLNKIMHHFLYGPEESFRILVELFSMTKEAKKNNLSKNIITEEKTLLIAKDIKSEYSTADIVLLKYFLKSLAVIFANYRVSLDERPHKLREEPAHLFVSRYLPLIDKLLVLVSSVEEEPQKSSKNRRKETNKGTNEGVHKGNSIKEAGL